MSKKVVNCRIEESAIEKIKLFSHQKNINIADYIRLAIDNQIKQDHLVYTGGILMEVPNPQFAAEETPETLEAVADAFDDLDRKLRRICPNLRMFFDTKQLSEFVEERLVINPGSKEQFEKAAYSVGMSGSYYEKSKNMVTFRWPTAEQDN